jgi:hypothetical protein
MTEPGGGLERELQRIAGVLRSLNRGFALVGGLAVSIRGEVRFTRDVDLAVDCESDKITEDLVRDLVARGYEIAAIVEHDVVSRLATVRLRSGAQINIDLLAASSGIEPEIIDSATGVEIEEIGTIPVARAEDLLATKLLSMSKRRPQDLVDARGLVGANPDLDIDDVRRRLELIRSRGFHRDRDLDARLDELLELSSGDC